MKLRVELVYETAVRFLALSPMARYIIGMHFGCGNYDNFIGREDLVAETIFKAAYQKNWVLFQKLVEQLQKNSRNDHA